MLRPLGERNRGAQWWVWVAIVLAFVGGCGIGRAASSSGEADMLAAAFDEMAASMEVAAEARQSEQEAYSLWMDAMQAEIDGIEYLQSEYPEIVGFDEAFDLAVDAKRHAAVAAELVGKYHDANKSEAARLSSLAEQYR